MNQTCPRRRADASPPALRRLPSSSRHSPHGLSLPERHWKGGEGRKGGLSTETDISLLDGSEHKTWWSLSLLVPGQAHPTDAPSQQGEATAAIPVEAQPVSAADPDWLIPKCLQACDGQNVSLTQGSGRAEVE